jgi:hypothetical protein
MNALSKLDLEDDFINCVGRSELPDVGDFSVNTASGLAKSQAGGLGKGSLKIYLRIFALMDKTIA